MRPFSRGAELKKVQTKNENQKICQKFTKIDRLKKIFSCGTTFWHQSFLSAPKRTNPPLLFSCVSLVRVAQNISLKIFLAFLSSFRIIFEHIIPQNV